MKTPNAEVVATELITEANFMGKKLHTHARAGDRGEILHREQVDGVELATVLWARSGTVATVFPGTGGNVRLLERERTSTPAERADTSARMARAQNQGTP